MDNTEMRTNREPETGFENGRGKREENYSESGAFSILNSIDEIRGIFRNHFESGWFLTVLERMSFNTIYLNDIRRLTELQSIYPSDYYHIRTGIIALEEFIRFSRRYLLPVLRDQLGISGFTRHAIPDQDRTTVVVKEFFAAAFPHNLRRLAELTALLTRSIYQLAAEEGLILSGGSTASIPSAAVEKIGAAHI